MRAHRGCSAHRVAALRAYSAEGTLNGTYSDWSAVTYLRMARAGCVLLARMLGIIAANRPVMKPMPMPSPIVVGSSGLRPLGWCSFPGFERRIVDVKSHRAMVSDTHRMRISVDLPREVFLRAIGMDLIHKVPYR